MGIYGGYFGLMSIAFIISRGALSRLDGFSGSRTY
jgi:hypothetical protein